MNVSVWFSFYFHFTLIRILIFSRLFARRGAFPVLILSRIYITRACCHDVLFDAHVVKHSCPPCNMYISKNRCENVCSLLRRKRSRVVQWDFIGWKGSHTKYFNYCSQVADAAILGMCRRCDGYFRSLYERILLRTAFSKPRWQHRELKRVAISFQRISNIIPDQ